MDEMIYRSATELARAIREKRVSATELVKAHLDRIAAVNPALNAVVQIRADAARVEAREADTAVARGEALGPLHGVPITIKDAFETAGIISTGGTLGRAAYLPERDATVVARLKAAGAIVLGKTNVPELSLAGETDNLVYGRTNNPYDLSRTPGGSSGGEAATVAAGGAALGIGSDLGGSIRNPAHFCGLAGLKPTSGLVPRTGHWPVITGALDSMVHVGPLARSVEDLALALRILAGVDGRDPAIVPISPGDPESVNMQGLRVAFHVENGLADPTPETDTTVRTVAHTLEVAGCIVEERCPDAMGRTQELQLHIMGSDEGTSVKAMLQEAGTTESHPFLFDTLDAFDLGAVSGADVSGWLVRRSEYRADMLEFMADYDVMLSPAMAGPAPPHGGVKVEDFSYLMVHNQTGWPAAVVRAGTSPEDMPIGVQVAARPWRDDVALAVARQIERDLGGWQPPPI